MTHTYDVIVVGLGAMGSATLQQLARRGHRVLGIDRFTPPHDRGSSHGLSRIIREAYFEDPRYVPLVQRAYECWAALEAETGTQIFRRTGGLMLGTPSNDVITGSIRSAVEHGLPHEVLSADEVMHRFPSFRPAADMIGVLESRAGMLAPERAIAAALSVARLHGAEVHTNEPMTSWRAGRDDVEVTTDSGTYRAARLILTVGAWAPEVLGDLQIPFAVQRNVLYWFSTAAHPREFMADRFPVFLFECRPGLTLYGFPDTGEGLKVGLHQYGEITTPDTLRRTVSDSEVAFVRTLLEEFMPHGNGALRQSAACMYTNVLDSHFIIDRHPKHSSVIVASPCSGHGFKFASAIGEVLADMATDRRVAFDTALFSLDRFTAAR